MLVKSPELIFNCAIPLHYTSEARSAFRIILENLEFNGDKKLLIPAYIGITDREGSGVLDPIKETKTPFRFYRVDKKLRPIKKELYRLIESKAYRALLIIHYFGFCQCDMADLTQMCHKNDVVLIEDCAHTVLCERANGMLGSFGDFAFYSIHKFLATKDGGCLRINNEDYAFILKGHSPSRIERRTLEIIGRADYMAIREKRRDNYLHLVELLEDFTDIEIMYKKLPKDISPHSLPVIIMKGQREALYFNLINRGIPVIALYYRLIDPIKNFNCNDSKYVSENILNMPIHQDIDRKDLLYIKKVLIEIYG